MTAPNPSLEERLGALEDRAALADVLHRYCRTLGDGDGWRMRRLIVHHTWEPPEIAKVYGGAG